MIFIIRERNGLIGLGKFRTNIEWVGRLIMIMEILSMLPVKISILAGMFGIVGLIGLAALLVSVIFLVLRVVNFDSILPAILCAVISIGLIAGGLAITPVPDVDAILQKAEQERQEREAEKEKSEEEGTDSEGEDGTEPNGDAADSEGEEQTQPEQRGEPMSFRTGGQPENAVQTLSGTLENGLRCNEIIGSEEVGNWRVRLTLPAEWKDLCVIENDGTYLYFSHKASMPDYGGRLFYLSVVNGPIDPDAHTVPEFNTVGEKDGVYLIALYATETQFDSQNRKMQEEFLQMMNAVPAILSTAEFERV